MNRLHEPKQYTLVTGSSELAIALTDIKDWLKIPSTLTADDSLLTALTKASMGYFEKITGRDLITKTYKTYLDKFPSSSGLYYYTGVSNLALQQHDNNLLIRKSKLQSVTSIQYYLDGVLTTWDSSNYYFVDSDDYSGIYLVDGKSFPSDVDTRKQAVIITFTAGYGVDSTAIPEDVKQALLQFISYLYENRGDCSESGKMNMAMNLFRLFTIIDI